MFSMKRVQLAVLLLIVAAFVASTTAPVVGGGSSSTVIQLTPAAVPGDPDDGALGKGALSNVKVDWGNPGGWNPPIYQARLRVTCEGLTPGAVYEVRTNGMDPKKAFNGMFVTWDFQASGSGTGAAGGNIKWGGWTGALHVAVVRVDENPDGTFVYATVLAGSFPF